MYCCLQSHKAKQFQECLAKPFWEGQGGGLTGRGSPLRPFTQCDRIWETWRKPSGHPGNCSPGWSCAARRGGEREARGARRCASGEAGPSAGVSCRAAKARGESRGEGPRDAGFPGAHPPRARVGPGTSRDSGLVPLGALGARAHPGDRTARWVLPGAGGYSACGRPGRCAHWSGCVCSVASNFSPIPLVSHRRAKDRARGAGHQCPRGAGSRWDGQQEDGAGGGRDARSKGRGRGPARSGRRVPGRRGRRRRVLGGSRR